MADSISYRLFELDDAEACRDLMLRCVDDFLGIEGPDGYDAVRRRIAGRPHREELSEMYTVVATDGGRLVGFGALKAFEVSRLYSDPEYRGRGIGKTLLRMVEEEAVRQGIRRVQLNAAVNAVGFYEYMGYSRMHRTVWELERAMITNIVMEKYFPDPNADPS